MRIQHDLRKRYWVFVVAAYYPSGGLDDIAHTTSDLEEARALKKAARDPYAYPSIFDSLENEMVDEEDNLWTAGDDR